MLCNRQIDSFRRLVDQARNIGLVVGHATSTVKHPTLDGWRLLVVQLTTIDDKPDGDA